MKNYQITIQSNENKNVSEIHFFITKLSKEFLMDILCPLTKYKLLIKEVIDCPRIVLSIEGLLNLIKDIKLKTKIARNVLKVEENTLGIFPNKPELLLNVWYGDNGEIRTYVNNIYFSEINKMFPKIFKQDTKNKFPYIEGALFLDYVDEVWKLHSVKSEFKVVYDEVVLES